ncbi:MAG: aminotransferase class I/II-fold pyridoxal phosphate-dependent enzyme [Synergistaceae bacterium]|nr:aminotransferase class I/II-fold pyridoxal phosphate-dependent enzyme [Synergistaceae bacterium]
MPLLLDAPNLGEREKEMLIECVDSTYVSTAGPFVPEFEERFARYLGAPAAVAVQSGTAAIHIALAELGVGEGDEVIVPALTFVASVNPVLYAGAAPVLLDVHADTWTLDPERVRDAITPRTRAIIPVHLYGNLCNMDALLEICGECSIAIVEDATEALGGTWRGRPAGTMGDFGCFSFNGNKLITTGGGGMVTARDPERAARVKYLVNQARDSSKGYYHPEMGYNYRMTNLEAALGLAQMERIEGFLKKKRAFARIYSEALDGIPGVAMQKEAHGAENAWWFPSVTVEHIPIPELQVALNERGVPTRRLFSPLHTFPYLRHHAPYPCPNAERIYEQGLNLPASTANDEDSVRRAAKTLREVLLKAGVRP